MEQSVLFSNCPLPNNLEVLSDGRDKITIPEYQKDVWA